MKNQLSRRDRGNGGAGADQIAGGSGDDTITGDNGNDDLHGGDGRDSLAGGKGDDLLHDDAGKDSLFGNAGRDLCYFGDDVREFLDQAKREQAFPEPVYGVSASRSTGLVLNACPLNTTDGRQVSGGLVKAGGSTLIMAGDVLKQWNGRGLDNSDAFVPHFDLPGGTFISSGSGLRLGGFSSGDLNYTGGVTFSDLQLLTQNYTGGAIITNGSAITSGSFSADLAKAFASVSV